ncbi:three-helix bundle dimerization domain-containing protein [Pengzhenrongella sicca]|uniref:DUF3562 domain-containing protein n=1 Tax=Pengzhenrongella sicca TaxID=2819238 RepID=A0A8A4ZGI0_9MICO|nr:hypothetical protein [Pengzhenrongella sicca]QTE30099.1 hypothetical protein J4E96_03510 [Pengzhenrongella sicca]
MENVDESQLIAQVTERLHGRFPDLAVETVRTAVLRAQLELDGREVRAFVPILVERAARESLASYARSIPARTARAGR